MDSPAGDQKRRKPIAVMPWCVFLSYLHTLKTRKIFLDPSLCRDNAKLAIQHY
jgi:hypothetical protein